MTGLPTPYLFVGMRGHVLALDRGTGAERWRTKLLRGDFVTLLEDGARLYAAAGGSIFALDATTGTVLWTNPMPSLGFGIASLLVPGTATAPEAAAARRGQRVPAEGVR